jgi:hypothetical protein
VRHRASLLQEVRYSAGGRGSAVVVGNGVEDLEFAATRKAYCEKNQKESLIGIRGIPIQVGVQSQDGSDVAAAVAVVRRGPDCHQALLGKHILVPLLHQLMRSADQIQLVHAGELAARKSAFTTNSCQERVIPLQ